MSNISSTTTTTVPPPQGTTLYSTTTTVAQTSTYFTTTVEETTTIDVTTYPPITTDVTVTTNPPISTNYADEPPSNPGAIVGGVLAGVVVAVVIIVIVIFVLRRRRRRSDGGAQCSPINKLPGKEDLEVHKTLEPTEKLYVNVSKTGETDENTDPSVGIDGYLKKTIHYHKAPTKTHRNDSNVENKSPQKSNKTRPRVDSMPSHQAPSPPGADADKTGYSTARVGEVKIANTVSGYTDVRVPDPGEYMEMSYGESANAEVVQSQSQVTNNGNVGGKTGDKLYVNENVLNPANPDNTKIYENVNSQDYKNVPSEKGYDNVNNEQSNAVNQPYANVGTEDADVEPVQDDVYEIP